ncbi:hypothetical protein P691DRAFT_809609 [Macrolepiota fuliginosa MF-IS2]|uniref:RBR-type E3 ubiquitin transferase n=1 Tax=Macrolepiota fuliginosa MF-IS2 TaxID=1400762 RepID=A0A9P6C424_9AGAR|nr:hypothetical protein P691DRAFT_809609 [Macrolepiota fuliginosa MF-IS2]
MQNLRSGNPYYTRPASSISNATSTITSPRLGSTGFRPSSIASGSTGYSVSDTSSARTLTNPNTNNDDIDMETSALIAELLYSDMQEILGSRKGKARTGAPLTDAEYALQLQSEQLEGMLTEVQDADIARRMQDALRMDRALIEEMALSEKVAQQDHEAALALERGEAMPRATKEQLSMGRGGVGGDGVLSGDMMEALSPKLKPTVPASALDKGKGKVVSFGSPPSPIPRLPGPALRFQPVERPQCVSCDDKIPAHKAFLKATCEHHYCTDCIINLVRAATTDESLFPVRCCRKAIPTESLTRFLSNALLTLFRAKSKEFGTPANARVYCCVPTCSAFLGNAEEAKGLSSWADRWGFISPPENLRCEKCRIETCIECRQRGHPNDTCKQNGAAQQVKELAREQKWQTCPKCERIIELSFGCNHMTCYCGHEFCYECAAEWKTCGCEQWEERRLYVTAEARMEREFGERARVEQPIAWEREVEAFAQNLRVNHDCFPGHRWKSHGPGMCEECGMYMPLFLKECKDCMLTVCRRCSFNRL